VAVAGTVGLDVEVPDGLFGVKVLLPIGAEDLPEVLLPSDFSCGG
jgi:hypothetical protein